MKVEKLPVDFVLSRANPDRGYKGEEKDYRLSRLETELQMFEPSQPRSAVINHILNLLFHIFPAQAKRRGGCSHVRLERFVSIFCGYMETDLLA